MKNRRRTHYEEEFFAQIEFYTEDYMARYCSKTLKKLMLVKHPKWLFKSIPVRFESLEYLSLVVHYTDPAISLKEVPFYVSFPNISYLKIQTMVDGIQPDLKMRLPLIKHLCLIVGKLDDRSGEIVELLRLNPQLEEFKLDCFSMSPEYNINLLHRVRDLLPKLKTLSVKKWIHLYESLYTDETFHFKNVVDFTLSLNKNYGRIPFTFDKLKRFQVEFSGAQLKYISDFIFTNEQLKAISLEKVWDINWSECISILSNTTVEEISIKCDDASHISSEYILRFLREIRFLKKLKLFTYCYFQRNFNDEVRTKISKQTMLQIDDIPHYFITFTP